MNETKKEVEKLLDLNKIIEYMENTPEESWCEKVVRNDKGENCFFGHLFDYSGGEKPLRGSNYGTFVWNVFEACIATTYMIYPVNDGKNPDYQQDTAKERVIAYLKDLRDGKKKTTSRLLEEYDANN